MNHLYVSTYCQHEQHSDCRLNCKVCAARCLCPCHSGDANDDLVEEGRRLASERDRLIARGIIPAELLVPIHPDDVERP